LLSFAAYAMLASNFRFAYATARSPYMALISAA
jgi:hypothetical protein